MALCPPENFILEIWQSCNSWQIAKLKNTSVYIIRGILQAMAIPVNSYDCFVGLIVTDNHVTEANQNTDCTLYLHCGCSALE